LWAEAAGGRVSAVALLALLARSALVAMAVAAEPLRVARAATTPVLGGRAGFDVDAARLRGRARRELVLVPFRWPELEASRAATSTWR
jgi:hypothetical protein